MEKLTLNEEKVWKILKDFPNGIKAKTLMQLTELSKTTLYECLDSLREKGYVEHKVQKWFPKLVEEKPSNDKAEIDKPSKLNFWAYLQWKRRFEEELRDKRIKELREHIRQLYRHYFGKEPPEWW